MKTLSEFVQPSTPTSVHPLYAHGATSGPRQFLYEQESAAVMKIRLGAAPPGEVRRVLEAAVDRINALHYGFASRQGGQHIAPDVRAAAGAVTALYAIEPVLPAQIFPLPGGGLQLEWHHGTLDIEIECPIDGSYYIFMSKDNDKLIDEEADGRRAHELFEMIRAALADAMGKSGGFLVLGRPV